MTTPLIVAPTRRKPRWGLRTLGFLLLGIVAVLTSSGMGHYTVGTLACTMISLGGAAVCSVRGWRSVKNLEWVQRRRPPNREYD